MLFRRDVLDGIRTGEITLAFRRWRKVSVRTHTLLRTAAGIVRVTGIDVIAPDAISEADARAAGYASRAALLASLAGRDGALYRIGLRLEGSDPRIELRSKAPSRTEMQDVLQRLERMDAVRDTPWTRPVLTLIADNPGTRAADLADRLGRETRPFKADIRKLKELGLTESLDVGYRLSPRGKAVLRRLGATP